MNLVLDTGILGKLCHPKSEQNRPVINRLEQLAQATSELNVIFLPEIADYELRRKLLHLIRRKQATQRSLDRLDELCELMEYLPLDTPTMRRAAEIWCETRVAGRPTADDHALDGDVILSAQAESVDGVVVTTNPKHFESIVPYVSWIDINSAGPTAPQ